MRRAVSGSGAPVSRMLWRAARAQPTGSQRHEPGAPGRARVPAQVRAADRLRLLWPTRVWSRLWLGFGSRPSLRLKFRLPARWSSSDVPVLPRSARIPADLAASPVRSGSGFQPYSYSSQAGVSPGQDPELGSRLLPWLWSRLLPRPGSRLDSSLVRPQALASHRSRIRTHIQAHRSNSRPRSPAPPQLRPRHRSSIVFRVWVLPASQVPVPVPAPSSFRAPASASLGSRL